MSVWKYILFPDSCIISWVNISLLTCKRQLSEAEVGMGVFFCCLHMSHYLCLWYNIIRRDQSFKVRCCSEDHTSQCWGGWKHKILCLLCRPLWASVLYALNGPDQDHAQPSGHSQDDNSAVSNTAGRDRRGGSKGQICPLPTFLGLNCGR